jgi:hypothetical protein
VTQLFSLRKNAIAKLPRWWEKALFGTETSAKNWTYFTRPKCLPYRERDPKEGPLAKAELILQMEVECAKKRDWSVLQSEETLVRIPKKRRHCP